MGLDITSYSGLRPAPDAAVEGDGEPVDYRNFWRLTDSLIGGTERHFPGRTAGIVPPAVYRFEGVLRFRAGSYSGFNEWRDALAKAAGYGSARAVWDAAPDFAGRPFVELIEFSDCEGVIGPVVAAKLAQDFAQFCCPDGDTWFIDLFRLWQKAFVLASYDGAVEFH